MIIHLNKNKNDFLIESILLSSCQFFKVQNERIYALNSLNIMQKDSKDFRTKSKTWFKSIFCCAVEEEFENEGKQMSTKKRVPMLKKKNKIQLSLIGSSYRFCLCKMSRKNVAIDAYFFKGVLPNPVNRYLSERIKGDIGLVRGQMSSIVTRNILHPVLLQNEKGATPSYTGEVVIGTIKSFSLKKVDIMVYRPPLQLLYSLMNHNTEYSTSLAQQIDSLCKSFDKLVIMLPAETILDQLGMVLPHQHAKQIQIQSIMINGTCIMYIVYIGDPTWIRIKQEDKLEYIIGQLQCPNQENNIRKLLELMLQTVDIDQVIRILVIAIAEEKIFETNLNTFLRLVSANNIVSSSEIQKLFHNTNFAVANTPNISRTGSFGCITAQLSFKDQELLNKGNKQLSLNYQVESHFQEEFTLYTSQLSEQG